MSNIFIDQNLGTNLWKSDVEVSQSKPYGDVGQIENKGYNTDPKIANNRGKILHFSTFV